MTEAKQDVRGLQVELAWMEHRGAESKMRRNLEMAKCLPLDSQDQRALRALDGDFVISADGETASITGEMEVTAVRLDDARLQLRLKFPGGEELDVRIARAQLLQELDVEVDES
jgi:hypothetical protein